MDSKVLSTVTMKLKLDFDPDELQRDIDKYVAAMQKYEKEAIEANEIADKVDNAQSQISDSSSGSVAQNIGSAGEALGKAADAGVKLLKGVFSILEELHQKVLGASPLLQSIEQLFSLAVNLFFMPIGNALAEEMIPATLELVDGVMEIWDAFEGMSLGEMVSEAIQLGVDLFSEYFDDLGQQLATQEGLVGSIGKFLVTISNIIDALPGILDIGIEILGFILENIDKVISAIVAFKVASLAMDVAMMATIATSNTVAGWGGAGYIAAAAGTAIAAGAGLITYNAISGTLNTSDVAGASTSGGNTYNYTINQSGIMSEDEASKFVKDIVDTNTSLNSTR